MNEDKFMTAILGFALGVGFWWAIGIILILVFAALGLGEKAYALLYAGYLPSAIAGTTIALCLYKDD